MAGLREKREKKIERIDCSILTVLGRLRVFDSITEIVVKVSPKTELQVYSYSPA